MKNKTKDLTEGSIGKLILMFALPLLGSSLIQQMYSTVDLIFVGRCIGKEASAAVGSSDLLVTCIVGLFTGISVGSGVVAAQAFGQKNNKTLHKVIQTAFFFGLIGALVLMIGGIILAPTFLHWLDTPAEVFDMAVLYLRIYFAGIFGIVEYNLCSGIVRSLGDARSALKFQIFGGVANIVCDYLFIVVFHMGIAGAALATIGAQIVSALLTIRYLCKLHPEIALKVTCPMLDGQVLKKLLLVGIPSGIQSMVVSFSNLFIQSIINSFSVDAMAAFAAYFKIEMFLYYPSLSYGQALVTYTAQNYGAGKVDRVRKGTWITQLMSICTVAIVSFVMILFIRPIFGLFNSDPGVLADGVRVAMITFPIYFLCTIQECMSAVSKGVGKAIAPMVIILTCMCFFRIVILRILVGIKHEIEMVAIVYPITWVLAGIAMTVNCLIILKKLKNNQLS